MKSILPAVKHFIRDEQGVTSIEYALMASLMTTVIVAGVALAKEGISSAFTSIKTHLVTGV